ncbi:MAG: ATP-binding protein [Candidatus Binatia bacterium]
MTSLLHKLLLSSLLVILLPMGLGILWTSNTLSTLLERRFVEKSKTQAEQVKLLLDAKQEVATGLAGWIAEMPGVKGKLEQNDRRGLFQILLPVVGSVELDFIEILDREGRIFLRVHNPSRFGDRPALTKDVLGLLQGMRDLPNYGVEEREGKAYLRASESIEGREGILGVVSAGYAINRDFLAELERVVAARAVIEIGDRLYPAEETPRSAKARAGQAQEINGLEFQWHREGSSPSLEVRLPLETLRGTEGVISLFFPSQEMTTAIGTLQRTLLSVAFVGIVLAFSVSWYLSRRLTKPLKRLVWATKEVGAGNYASAVRTDSKDEIGALANSFNRMLEELRRSEAEVESYRKELERKFAETGEELAETAKKRAAMAHMIAHDLKNPLLGIKKTLERLEQSAPEGNGEQRKTILKDLLNASDLVIGMVNEMLDLYRSDFGDLPLSLTRFEIEEPIQTSLHILGPELDDKKLHVVRRSEPAEISVLGDKRRLTRLLINLLSNAIKFSPDRGRITISTTLLDGSGRTKNDVLVRVEDEGAGIPEKDLPRLFDRFYSRDQGNVATGTGLGLPYCKLVAEAHHGKIWAQNRRDGGFGVSLLLPINVESEQNRILHS